MNMVSHKLKQDAVAETVRKWIMDGRYKEGDQLPPDTELSELFGMNKHTVAQGLNQLVSEDLLTRARMRGTIVKRTFTPPASDAVPLVSSSEGHFYSDMVKELNQCLLDQKLYPVLINNQMFYSKTYLNSIFKAVKGVTIMQYYQGLKIEEAKRLLSELKTSDFNIDSIYVDCGFRSRSTFYMVLKKMTGMTPAAWLEDR